MAKMYETETIIVARFSVENIGHEVNKIYPGMKSTINLWTTRRTITSCTKNTMKPLKDKQTHLEKATK